jgi:hypothetical protein
MKILLKQLVVSQMEYCSILWSPRDQKQINLLESVQADFTRRISKYQTYDEKLQMPICNMRYEERLKDLKIYSLERRRERMQILYLYKIMLHAVPNPGFKWNYCPRQKCLRFTPKISHKQGWAHTLRNSSFAAIGPQLFNSLPPELRAIPNPDNTNEKSIKEFKKAVDEYLRGIPDIPGTKNSILYHKDIDYGAVNGPAKSRWGGGGSCHGADEAQGNGSDTRKGSSAGSTCGSGSGGGSLGRRSNSRGRGRSRSHASRLNMDTVLNAIKRNSDNR